MSTGILFWGLGKRVKCKNINTVTQVHLEMDKESATSAQSIYREHNSEAASLCVPLDCLWKCGMIKVSWLVLGVNSYSKIEIFICFKNYESQNYWRNFKRNKTFKNTIPVILVNIQVILFTYIYIEILYKKINPEFSLTQYVFIFLVILWVIFGHDILTFMVSHNAEVRHWPWLVWGYFGEGNSTFVAIQWLFVTLFPTGCWPNILRSHLVPCHMATITNNMYVSSKQAN